MSSAGNSSQTVGEAVSRLALASSACAMAILDRDGRWLEANPATGRLLGRDATQLAGTAMVDAVAGRDAQMLRDAFDAVAAGGAPARVSLAFVHADGHEVRARVSLAPMRDDAGQVCSVVMNADEDDAAETARQLAGARAELAALHGLQASFAHGVSHDLRAP